MKGRIVGEGDHARYYLVDGCSETQVSKEEFARVFPDKPLTGDGSSLCGSWGCKIHSDALAVHPEQRAEAEARARRHGLPTEYDREGRPVLTSRAHRKKLLRLEGLHDRDGGYSD